MESRAKKEIELVKFILNNFEYPVKETCPWVPLRALLNRMPARRATRLAKPLRRQGPSPRTSASRYRS